MDRQAIWQACVRPKDQKPGLPNPNPNHFVVVVVVAKLTNSSELEQLPNFERGSKDRKSTRLNSSHSGESRMPSSA